MNRRTFLQAVSTLAAAVKGLGSAVREEIPDPSALRPVHRHPGACQYEFKDRLCGYKEELHGKNAPEGGFQGCDGSLKDCEKRGHPASWPGRVSNRGETITHEQNVEAQRISTEAAKKREAERRAECDRYLADHPPVTDEDWDDEEEPDYPEFYDEDDELYVWDEPTMGDGYRQVESD